MGCGQEASGGQRWDIVVAHEQLPHIFQARCNLQNTTI